MKEGVKVFSRSSLHAKVIIIDKTMIVSSANISNNSKTVLDEAGIITMEPIAIRRASDFFEKLCTEPVRDHYLKECIKAYRPPNFKAAATIVRKQTKQKKRVKQAKLWFIGGLRLIEPAKEDQKTIDRVVKRSERKLSDPDKTVVSWIRYPRPLKFFNQLRDGDWVVQCINEDGDRYIEPPCQVIGHDSYISHSGKKYHMLMLESIESGESMSLSAFRKKVRTQEPALDQKSPRTRAIENDEHADAILSFWKPSGRLSKQKKK
jgi:hypothetical protein